MSCTWTRTRLSLFNKIFSRTRVASSDDSLTISPTMKLRIPIDPLGYPISIAPMVKFCKDNTHCGVRSRLYLGTVRGEATSISSEQASPEWQGPNTMITKCSTIHQSISHDSAFLVLPTSSTPSFLSFFLLTFVWENFDRSRIESTRLHASG